MIDVVSQIFATFQATWPRRWRTIWKTNEDVQFSKRQWLLAFRDAGLTPRKLLIGLKVIRSRPWPPDNPGEFLEACKIVPESIGAPPEEVAWREATNRPPHSDWKPWSHKTVYWAAVWTGLTDLAERGQRMRKKFEAEYQKALEHAESLSKPPAGGLPERTLKERDEQMEAAAEEGIAACRRALRGEP